ncbi:MAG TPA: lactonase family protein [Acetobacteraceae bacterium]
MPSHLDLVAGSYTEIRPGRDAAGEGLSLLRLDPASGALTTLDVLGGLLNPSYVRPQGSVIHAVCETPADHAGLATVQVQAGRLALLGQVPIPGDGPCHIDRHPGGRWLAVACYGSGHVMVLPLDAAGVAQPACCVVAHRGSGPNPARQAGPHAHAVCFSPDGRVLLVADLGTDEVWCHGFDAATGALEQEPPRWQAPPAGPSGNGPRLLLFSPDGGHVILLNEMANTVMSLRWQDGALMLRDTTSTLPPGWSGETTAAGLRWHPSGRFFAASNRGADSIALFSFDAASGAIARVAGIATGPKPRDFEFSPCGRWLLAASQDGDSIAVLEADAARGRLSDTGIRHRVLTPSCVRFLSSAEHPSP